MNYENVPNFHYTPMILDIRYNEVDPHVWGDNIHLGPLNFVSHEIYDLRVNDDVTLRVARAFAPSIGHYLGVYVVNSDGLSDHSTGIIGTGGVIY